MYTINKTTVIVEGKIVTTYGIASKRDNSVIYPDVSPDKDKVVGFINRLNEADIPPDHLIFYIEDFLLDR